MTETKAILSIHYGPQEDCDAMLARFADARLRQGVRVAGLVQINGAEAQCDLLAMELRDLSSGRRIDICQDLGTGSAGSCRLDPQALAAAAALFSSSISTSTELAIINKFGRMEADGAGLLQEIGDVVGRGIPLVIGVPQRFALEWHRFAEGLDQRVSVDEAALDAWWRDVSALRQLAG